MFCKKFNLKPNKHQWNFNMVLNFRQNKSNSHYCVRGYQSQFVFQHLLFSKIFHVTLKKYSKKTLIFVKLFLEMDLLLMEYLFVCFLNILSTLFNADKILRYIRCTAPVQQKNDLLNRV